MDLGDVSGCPKCESTEDVFLVVIETFLANTYPCPVDNSIEHDPNKKCAHYGCLNCGHKWGIVFYKQCPECGPCNNFGRKKQTGLKGFDG